MDLLTYLLTYLLWERLLSSVSDEWVFSAGCRCCVQYRRYEYICWSWRKWTSYVRTSARGTSRACEPRCRTNSFCIWTRLTPSACRAPGCRRGGLCCRRHTTARCHPWPARKDLWGRTSDLDWPTEWRQTTRSRTSLCRSMYDSVPLPVIAPFCESLASFSVAYQNLTGRVW